MRRYIPDYSDEGISRERYYELLHFCRQYPEWKKSAASLLGTSAQRYSTEAHAAGTVSDPTERAAAKRETYLNRIQIVDTAAYNAGNAWSDTLIRNVCYGVPLAAIDPIMMPSSNRNTYFVVKKKFFVLLDALQQGMKD